MSALLPVGSRHAIVSVQKKPRTVASLSSKPAASSSDGKRPKRSLPLEVADELGSWADHFYRLVDAEAQIDRAIELKRHELQSCIASAAEAGTAFPSLISCVPLPALRTLRIFVSSQLARQAADPNLCQWTVKVWAQPHLDSGYDAVAFGDDPATL